MAADKPKPIRRPLFFENGPQVQMPGAEIDSAVRIFFVRANGAFPLNLGAIEMRIAIVITTEGRTHATDHLVQSLRECALAAGLSTCCLGQGQVA